MLPGTVHCQGVTDQGLRRLGSLPAGQLRIVGFRDSTISDDGLIDLLRTRPATVSEGLFFKSCPISDRVLPHLPWTGTRYSFSGTNVTLRGVVAQVGHRAGAPCVYSTRIDIGWDYRERTGEARRPERARIYGGSCDGWVYLDQALADLREEDLLQLPDLSWVYFQTNERIDTHLHFLRHHKRLVALSVQRYACEPEVIEKIAQLSHLRHLTLTCGVSEPVADIAPLANLSELCELYITHLPIGDDGLKAVGQLNNLVRLEVVGSRVQAQWLKPLGTLQRLTYLRISGTGNWDAGVDELTRLTNLQYLTIERATLSPQSIRRLQAMPHMQRFAHVPGE